VSAVNDPATVFHDEFVAAASLAPVPIAKVPGVEVGAAALVRAESGSPLSDNLAMLSARSMLLHAASVKPSWWIRPACSSGLIRSDLTTMTSPAGFPLQFGINRPECISELDSPSPDCQRCSVWLRTAFLGRHEGLPEAIPRTLVKFRDRKETYLVN
jgi:hypothetical protein